MQCVSAMPWNASLLGCATSLFGTLRRLVVCLFSNFSEFDLIRSKVHHITIQFTPLNEINEMNRLSMRINKPV